MVRRGRRQQGCPGAVSTEQGRGAEIEGAIGRDLDGLRDAGGIFRQGPGGEMARLAHLVKKSNHMGRVKVDQTNFNSAAEMREEFPGAVILRSGAAQASNDVFASRLW